MDTNLETQLEPAQLKELQLIAAMIARGEPPDVIERRWERFVTTVASKLGLSETEPADVTAIVQWVLRESYMETIKDLQFYADEVRFYDELKKAISDEQTQDSETLEAYILRMEQGLTAVGDEAQLANIDLQNKLQQQQQTLQVMSNIAKMLHDTAMAIIRKIG